MTQRRYTEQEIAAIFQRAAQEYDSDATNARGEGLTLAEMQDIGREVGIPAEFIGRAAAAVDSSVATLPVKKTLGIPVTVGKTLDLPGDFTDADWNALVSDLHDTFHVPGEVTTSGARRQWRVGNLHVWVEPTDTGHRLRMRSLNEFKRMGLLMGGMFFVMGLVFMALVMAKDGPAQFDDLLFAMLFAAGGLSSIGFSVLTLPRWREERAEQMDAIAKRASERASSRIASSRTEEVSDVLSKTGSITPRIELDDDVFDKIDNPTLGSRNRQRE